MSESPDVITPSESSPRPYPLLALLAAVLAIVVCLNLRLLEVPAWEQDFYQVQGEPLLATHDAYFFLAGAQGTGRPQASHEPFFQLTRFFHAVTGMPYSSVGFWMPVFLAPLVILPLAFLAWREGFPEAILPMGIMAGGIMGFMLRTRLGYYDHDMLSLFLPVLFAAGLLIFLDRWLRLARDVDFSPEMKNIPQSWGCLLPCLPLGFLGWLWVAFYPSGQPILLAIMAMGALTAMALTPGIAARAIIFVCLGMILLLALNPVWGILLVLAGIFVLFTGMPWRLKPLALWTMFTVFCAVIFFGATLDAQLGELLRQLAKYSPILTETNQTMDTLALPSVMQSVREARLLPLHIMAERSGVTWWLFALGVVGYVYLCLRRPLFLLFAPLLLLSAGAVYLGARFTMYGGVPLGIGLGLGLALLMAQVGLRQRVRTIVLGAFAVVIAALLWAQTESFQPNPVLTQAYADALLELREVTPPDARIWLWWDYGYAAQFFARRASFGDGAYNSSSYLYPMALIHATHSPMQAAQMIKMVTARQMERWELKEGGQGESARLKNDYSEQPGAIPWSLYLQPPLHDLLAMDARQVREVVDALAEERRSWPGNMPEQYFLVSWQNLALSYWITRFGNWDLRTGQGHGGRMQRMGGEISLDLEAGYLQRPDEDPLALEGFLPVSEQNGTELHWDHDSGTFAVYNDYMKQFLILDRTLYHSMLVRMLLADPAEFAEDFELVVDRYPWVRVYRVL